MYVLSHMPAAEALGVETSAFASAPVAPLSLCSPPTVAELPCCAPRYLLSLVWVLLFKIRRMGGTSSRAINACFLPARMKCYQEILSKGRDTHALLRKDDLQVLWACDKTPS